MIAFHDHLLDIEHDAAIVCSTEPKNLPCSGTPHPTATRFFCAWISSGVPHGFHAGRAQKYNRRKPNTARRLQAVLSLPTPFIRWVPTKKPVGGHHGQ